MGYLDQKRATLSSDPVFTILGPPCISIDITNENQLKLSVKVINNLTSLKNFTLELPEVAIFLGTTVGVMKRKL